MKSANNDKWRIWDNSEDYGQVFYKRAIGELPEMECSKKMAKELSSVIRDSDKVLDVGCGAGHYLRSLRREVKRDFIYTGVDQTEHYINLARTAYHGDNKASFMVSDIYDIQMPNESYDIVMCNNVLLHLPSIKKPLTELIRIAKRTVFVRFLCGEKSFIIKDIQPEGEEFNDDGEPIAFHYHSIYSKNYVNKILSNLPRVKNWVINPDLDFDKQNIINSVKDHNGYSSATRMIGDFQVNGYILQPWAVLEVNLC